MSDAEIGLTVTYKDAEFHMYSTTPRRYVVKTDHYRRVVNITRGRWETWRDKRTVEQRIEAAKDELRELEAERAVHVLLEEP